MQAPQISTLESREDSPSPPPPPPQVESTEPPAEKPPQLNTLSKPSRAPQTPVKPIREVYVEEDEEDQLIDDDDNADSGSKQTANPMGHGTAHQPSLPAVATAPAAPPPPYVPVDAVAQPHLTAAASTIPKKRAYTRRREKTSGGTPTSTPGIPGGADDAASVDSAPSSSKRKRVRSAPRATLEVKRQEVGTQDGSSLMWRLNEASGVLPPPPDLQTPPIPSSAPTPTPTPAEKRKRGAGKAGARDESGAGVPQKRNRSNKVVVPAHIDQNMMEPFHQDPDHHTPMEQSYSSNHYSQPPPPEIYPPYLPLDHIEHFHIPENLDPEELPSTALAAAPLRPLPYSTNAVAPSSTTPWSYYDGPLDRGRCRTWTKAARTIQTIGGGTFLAKTWIGGEHTEVVRAPRPPPPLAVETAVKASTPSFSGKAPKPKKSKSRKVPVSEASAAAPSALRTPPIQRNENAMADAAQELEMLVDT